MSQPRRRKRKHVSDLGAKSPVLYRPCLILAVKGFACASETSLRLRRLGWDIYQACVGPEVRRLSRMLDPDVVVMDTDLEGESGWLTCAKLEQERPGREVVLVSGEDSPCNRALAAFVGASVLVSRQHNLVALLQSRRVIAGGRALVEAA